MLAAVRVAFARRDVVGFGVTCLGVVAGAGWGIGAWPLILDTGYAAAASVVDVVRMLFS